MCAYTQPFDVTQLRYPEYNNNNKRLRYQGLRGLLEEWPIALFLRQVEDLNKDIQFTREQLQQCWFYILKKEYNVLRDTTQLHTTKRRLAAHDLLEKGYEEVHARHWLTKTEEVAAEAEKFQSERMQAAQNDLSRVTITAHSYGDIYQQDQGDQIMVDGGLTGEDQAEQMSIAKKQEKQKQQTDLQRIFETFLEARGNAAANQGNGIEINGNNSGMATKEVLRKQFTAARKVCRVKGRAALKFKLEMIEGQRTTMLGTPVYDAMLQDIRDLIRTTHEAILNRPLSNEEVETELDTVLISAVPMPIYHGMKHKNGRREFRLRHILKYHLPLSEEDERFLEHRKHAAPEFEKKFIQTEDRRKQMHSAPLPTPDEMAKMTKKQRTRAKWEQKQGYVHGDRRQKKLERRLQENKQDGGLAVATSSNKTPLSTDNEVRGQTRRRHSKSHLNAAAEAQTGTHQMLMFNGADVEMDADEQEDDTDFAPPNAHARPTMASSKQLRSASRKQNKSHTETKRAEWKMELEIRAGRNEQVGDDDLTG